MISAPQRNRPAIIAQILQGRLVRCYRLLKLLFQFIRALLQLPDALQVLRQSATTLRQLEKLAAIFDVLLTRLVLLLRQASGHLAHSEHVGTAFGSPAEIGRLFLTDHLLAFEITSIVLLVAAIGGVILGAHSRRAVDQVPPL